MALDTTEVSQVVARALDKLDRLTSEDDLEVENLRVGAVMLVVGLDYDTPLEYRGERWEQGTLTYVFVEPENPRVAMGLLKAADSHVDG